MFDVIMNQCLKAYSMDKNKKETEGIKISWLGFLKSHPSSFDRFELHSKILVACCSFCRLFKIKINGNHKSLPVIILPGGCNEARILCLKMQRQPFLVTVTSAGFPAQQVSAATATFHLKVIWTVALLEIGHTAKPSIHLQVEEERKKKGPVKTLVH